MVSGADASSTISQQAPRLDLLRTGEPDAARFALPNVEDLPDAEERARDTAERLVAQTLVLPVLRQVRESNEAAAPFAPGEGEKQFGALLDERIAEDITKAAGFPLVDRLARDLLRDRLTSPEGA